MSLKTKFAFIDRDGTIIEEPEDFQVDRLDKIRFVPGVLPALRDLKRLGFKLIMVTNQDGLGTSSFPQEDFDQCHGFIMNVLETQGAGFDRVAICPHFEKDLCECRKPRTGLLLPELKSGEIDFEKSFVAGDRQSDELLAEKMGLKFFSLKTSTWPEIMTELTSRGRRAHTQRKTKETAIEVFVDLDHAAAPEVSTGHGFFDHMLEQIGKHASITLKVKCQGDLHIDEHHTVEDVGLALGEALQRALGEKRGIERYGFLLPMDETEVKTSLDLSGRPYFVFSGSFPRPEVGGLSTEMVIHFFRSVSETLKANLHLEVQGENTHHMVEGCFKAFARVLKQAIKLTGDDTLPSTKGSL